MDFLAPITRYMSILGDPGADSRGEGKSKREEKYGTKKSKEWREEPQGTMSYQTSSKRSPLFWLLIAARKLLCFSSRRSLLFFMPYFPTRLDVPSPPLSALGSRRMVHENQQAILICPSYCIIVFWYPRRSIGSSHTSFTAYIRGIGACIQLSIAVNAFLNTALCFVLLVIERFSYDLEKRFP